ncbi:MAG TPA: hypothetical protein VGF85_06940 [Opitutaceae bacterium]|jgi:hypothetical protein
MTQHPIKFGHLFLLTCVLAHSRAQTQVSLAQLPEGDAGIASRYPKDTDIEKAPEVIFADNFEGYASVPDLRKKWDVLINDSNLAIADSPETTHGRGKSLQLSIPKRDTPLATGVAKLLTHTQNVLFLRWYVKFDRGWFIPTASVHNGGTMSSRYFDNGRATPGVRADGRNKFLVSFENENSVGEAPGHMNVYIYWPEQGSQWGDHFFPSGYVLPHSDSRSGQATFGSHFQSRKDFSPQLDRWYCYEYMVEANTPGQRDGRVALWVDGKLIADFPNLRLRDVSSLEIDRFGLDLYVAKNTARQNRKWIDDVVAATSYIGPMSGSK